MRLILVRHTRPAVPEGVCYGVTDLDVAPTFDREAARVVASLPAVERLVTSPLRRCVRLAERIAAARGLTPVVDGRLREMGLRPLGGHPWDEIDRSELDAGPRTSSTPGPTAARACGWYPSGSGRPSRIAGAAACRTR